MTEKKIRKWKGWQKNGGRKKIIFLLLHFSTSHSMISQQRFAHHARQLVRHTDLDALLWANLGRREITFSCLQSEN